MENGTKTEVQLDVDSFTLGSLFTPMQMPPASNPSGGIWTPLPMECCGDGFKHTLGMVKDKIPTNILTRGNGLVDINVFTRRAGLQNMLGAQYGSGNGRKSN